LFRILRADVINFDAESRILAAILERHPAQGLGIGGGVMEAEARRIGWQKLVHELKEYAAISLYLYVCFLAMLLYKAAILGAQGVDYAPYGLAAVKALILAKFMLLMHEIHIGERYRSKRLIYMVLYQSFVFLLVLLALTYVEEIIVGAIHGRTVTQSIADIAGGTWLELVATSFLLWLILLPYFGFRLVGDALGGGELRRILLG
jgi:hypothetical protein